MTNKQIISTFSEYLDECGLAHSFESFLYSKGLTIESLFNTTIEQNLRNRLLEYIEFINTTPNKIKEGKVKNPFPIGTRSVYVFASGGDISDSAKWKLLTFFESQEK
jgi:hypothetical protein